MSISSERVRGGARSASLTQVQCVGWNGSWTRAEGYVHIMSRSYPSSGAVASPDAGVLSRQTHYAEFFDLATLPDRYGIVVGNCQAESLRVVMDAPDRRFVRVPAVHELTSSEALRLLELVEGAAVVISQPIRDDYRGMPVGTRQLAAVTTARLITFPTVRFAGLHPFQVAMRVSGVEEDPPIVAYHDIRTLAATAGVPVRAELGQAEIRAVAHASVQELRAREQHIDVPVSDLFDVVSADHARTVNHPGNSIWLPLGARVLKAMGTRDAPTDPGRPLLNAVRAPLVPEVVETWSLPDEPRLHWTVEGAEVDESEIRESHLAWYADHPEFVNAAMPRVKPLLDVWAA